MPTIPHWLYWLIAAAVVAALIAATTLMPVA